MISPKLLFYYIKISLNIFRLIFIILPWLKQIIILCITDVHLCGKTCGSKWPSLHAVIVET